MDPFALGTVAVLAAGGATAALSARCATADRRGLRVAALLTSTSLVAGSLYPLFLAGWLAAMACDETCSDNPADWTADRFTWQWPVSGVIALLAAGTAAAALICIARRSYDRARILALISPALWLIWAWAFATAV